MKVEDGFETTSDYIKAILRDDDMDWTQAHAQPKNEIEEIERYFEENWPTFQWKSLPTNSDSAYRFCSKSGLEVRLFHQNKVGSDPHWLALVQNDGELGRSDGKADWETAAELAMTRAMTRLEEKIERHMGILKQILRSRKVLSER